jgi:hypothetical protein
MTNLAASAPRSQEIRPESDPAPFSLKWLITDLRGFRDGMIGNDRWHRAAILAGQLALLAREYERGRRPSRKALKRFFQFVAREQTL